MVAAAAGVYWAAQCPNSTLARAIGSGMGIFSTGQPVSPCVAENQPWAPAPDCDPPPCPRLTAENTDTGEPPLDEAQRSILQLIDVRLLSEAMHPLGQNPAQEECADIKIPAEDLIPVAGETVSTPMIPTPIYFTNDSSSIMPPCCDVAECPKHMSRCGQGGECPDIMPRCDEDEECPHTMPRCHADEKCPKSMPSCTEEEEVPAVKPTAEEAETKDRCIFSFWMSLFKNAAKSEPAEEAEPMPSAEPPNCKEDPAYHYQYPGCPYTGVCPYSGKSVSDSMDAPKPEEKKSPMSEPAPAGKRGHRNVPSCKDPPGSEDTPVHPEVDTMECRPSDAKNSAPETASLRRPW
jgi:hypothetical protein